jgi:hypothetical protein
MKFRKLRITISVVCAIACVLLIALWVRSNNTFDRLGIILSKERVLVLVSNAGHLSAVVVSYHPDMGMGGFDYGPLVPPRPEFANTSWPGRTFAGFGWISETEYDFVPNYPAQAKWQHLNLRERSWTENATGLIIPTWVLVLPPFCLGIACAFGCLVPRRISLRTLLIATTLVAVLLGLIIFLSKKGSPPRRSPPPIFRVQLSENNFPATPE